MSDAVRHPGQDDNSRKMSPNIWNHLPAISDVEYDPAIGWGTYFDFNYGDEAAPGVWTATQATAGTFTSMAVEGGVLQIDANSTTATQGGQIQLLPCPLKPEADYTIAFECRLRVDGIANLNVEFFAGLAESDTTIIASSAVSTANHIGFSSVTDDGVLLPIVEDAGTADNNATTNTIVDDTFVKLGFLVEGTSRIRWFVDGAEKTAVEHPADSMPTVVLYPSFVCQSGGTDQPQMEIDWVAAYKFVGQPH